MKQLYLELHSGAAGDMLLAALYELAPDRQSALARLNALGLDAHHVRFVAEPAEDHGVHGTHMHVVVGGEEEGHAHHAHHHAHRDLGDVYEILDSLHASDAVRAQAKAVYRAIADAEGAVHGETVERVHFHELGALDAIADVAGVCTLLEILSPDRITASAVAVGSGTVKCAHGVLPVPAPATARLLQGLSVTSGDVSGELCTPTGAALLRQFVTEFGPLPSMRLSGCGVGLGTRHYDAALNAVRAFWGEADAPVGERVLELACNLDDMTGEALAFAAEILFAAGALDAWTEPITMKKGRPAVTLRCLCNPEDASKFSQLLFRHTTTLGVRQTLCSRLCMDRRQELVLTKHGPVRVKVAHGFGITRQKPEYEDLAAIARKEGMSLEQACHVLNGDA